jgi:para-nitrobenzyl esterase
MQASIGRHTRAGLLGTAAFALAMAAAAGHAQAAAPKAVTQNGAVEGIYANDMAEFLGIRYAAPPVGPLRWQPTQPVPASMATHVARAYGPHCAQLASPYGLASTSEDCLYLNVYAPKTAPANASLPVMVWIHGGALVVGESEDYNPEALVKAGNVIVVTINYRLGYLGYLAVSGLDQEGHVAANYGLQDQQFALAWVRNNIAGFGGNAANITVFGESAGGLSTLSNLSSPTAHGLFDKAIVESGAYALTLPTLPEAEAAGAVIASALGCAPTDTTCLRAASVQQILAQQTSPTLSLTTIVDGTTLPLDINGALESGAFNHVPLMNGSNHDEYRQFLSADAALPARDYPAAVESVYGPQFGQAVVAEYPVGTYPQPVLTLAAVITDQSFACPARRVDQLAAAYVPVYAYEFNDENAPEDFLPPSGYPFGASHASEIQFLFQIPKLPTAASLSKAEDTLSNDMVHYWTSFAASGVPSGSRAPSWSPFTKSSPTIQSLKPPTPRPELNFSAEHKCVFWTPVDGN